MWRLIKADLNYQKVILVPIYVSFLALLASLTWVPQVLYFPDIVFPKRAVISLWLLFYLASIGVFNTSFSSRGINVREKRNRLHTLLPVSPRQIGASRVLALVLAWTGLVGVFLLFLLASGEWAAFWTKSTWPQTLLALTGAFFLGSAHGLVMEDLKTMFLTDRKIFRIQWKHIFYTFAVITAVLYFVAICLTIMCLLPQVATSDTVGAKVAFCLQSWPCAVLLLISGTAMMLASLKTFKLRKSFLE